MQLDRSSTAPVGHLGEYGLTVDTWSDTSSCSSTFSIGALVSSLEPQVVVPPPCSSHSHGCQHYCSSWWTQAGPWAPQSHQRSHGHQHDQGGQVAPHGKNSRSASPAAAGRINTLFAQVVLLLVDPGPRQLTWDTPSSHPITHIDLLICLLSS